MNFDGYPKDSLLKPLSYLQQRHLKMKCCPRCDTSPKAAINFTPPTPFMTCARQISKTQCCLQTMFRYPKPFTFDPPHHLPRTPHSIFFFPLFFLQIFVGPTSVFFVTLRFLFRPWPRGDTSGRSRSKSWPATGQAIRTSQRLVRLVRLKGSTEWEVSASRKQRRRTLLDKGKRSRTCRCFHKTRRKNLNHKKR